MVESPAWYSLKRRNSVSDLVNLLHPPYTLWHLSYVLMGIGLSSIIYPERSLATILAFFLGLGIGAHALDETMGNPLQTRLTKEDLYAIGFSALVVSTAIGLYYVLILSIWILPFIVTETFFAVTYNLEMFNKKLHSTLVFAISWGTVPFLTGYFVNTLTLDTPSLVMAITVGLLTVVQKTLSTQSRKMRREMPDICGLTLSNGKVIPTTSNDLRQPAEKSLKLLTLALFLFAIVLISHHAL